MLFDGACDCYLCVRVQPSSDVILFMLLCLPAVIVCVDAPEEFSLRIRTVFAGLQLPKGRIPPSGLLPGHSSVHSTQDE